MRTRPGGTRLLASALLLGWAAVAVAVGGQADWRALAQDQTVNALPIGSFMSAEVGQRVQGLIWRGGIELQSASDTFGGLSGMGFTGPDGQVVFVSDRGNFVSAQLIHDEMGRPLSLIGVNIAPIRNSSGNELPRPYARDAESMAVIMRDGVPSAIRVGFENLTRVADFRLEDGVPDGAAKEVAIPKWLSDTRTNESIESLCIAPPASPVAGSTLIITEGVSDENGDHAAWLLGNRDRGSLSYVAGRGTNPTDCAFLPNGDLLVLERGVALLSFAARLARVPAAEVKPGALMKGETLLQVTGADIDNMEALGVYEGPDGTTRIVLVSDNNFNDWERNLLLEFSLAE